MTDAGPARDGRLERLAEAANALEAAIRDLGVGLSDDAIAEEYERNRARTDEFADTDVDPLAAQGEIVVAAVRQLLDVAYTELGGRGVLGGRKCFRQLPAADMHHVDTLNGSFWICEHSPSHREAS